MENKGNTMKITYNKNPLLTTVELDENEKKELWYKIKIQEMEEILFSAHFYLEEKYFDLKRAKDDLDPDYYCNEEDNKKSKLDERCDMLLETFLSELQSNHIGDCTCVACSCMKCHAEGLLGIDTIKGLGKHTAHKINAAFGINNEKNIDEAIEYLANYDPKPKDPESDAWKKMGGYEQYVPRWKEEAKLAHDWLVNYKINIFAKNQ